MDFVSFDRVKRYIRRHKEYCFKTINRELITEERKQSTEFKRPLSIKARHEFAKAFNLARVDGANK